MKNVVIEPMYVVEELVLCYLALREGFYFKETSKKNVFIELEPVVRRLDSVIHRIAIFSSFLKQLVNRSFSN